MDDLFTNYFSQTKQRIDIDFDMNNCNLKCLTKLTFILNKNFDNNNNNNNLILFLNAENIFIKEIYTFYKQKKFILKYHHNNPFYTLSYLNKLYENIEEIESFRNINRVDWEIKNKGNLKIEIPKNISSDLNNNINKFKIFISYEVIENNIGVIFQSFYEERNDYKHYLCYTPNFYFNTTNWVPCIYDLSLQIFWRLYLIVPMEYMSYSSLQMTKIISNKNKKIIINYSQEKMSAKNIGFIVVNKKIFIENFDINNKNYIIISNENKKEKIEKNLINNKLINTLYNFYDEFFDINESNQKSNLNTPTFIIFIPYLAINSPNLNIRNSFFGKDDFYFNIIKFPSLYVLPEKYIYNNQIPEIKNLQLKNLSKIFITNYIGGLIIEKTYADFWIINGFEVWLSYLFLSQCFGNSYVKNKIYKNILKFKKIVKHGNEKFPLYNNNFSHPIEIQLNYNCYLKSSIVIFLLESQVEKIFIQKVLKNILIERKIKGYNISTESLIKIFKKNCGNNLKHFMMLYVYKTGMLEINCKYNYNQKTNSIDIEIHTESIAKKYYNQHPYFIDKEINYNNIIKLNKNIQIIDFRTKANKNFDILFNLKIIQTNGIEIMKDPHEIKFEKEKENYFWNFPLISKIRKMPLKKREQDFIQDLINNTGISKIYKNEEIEEIFTKNSILWITIDSELTSLRVNHIKQQHILYDYIKIFREADIIGQMESLNNISKDKENFSDSIKILKSLIESNNIYYKLRIYALKVYIKIIIKTKNMKEYTFLIDYLEDCYIEILKNKTNLNYDTYFIMKKIIKYLSDFNEKFFNEFNVVGLINNSDIQNKIINKFLSILISNELNTISNYDDCYIMSEILIGCSKLNLQEKNLILLKKILKNLRVEKLKRSYNEITIISCILSFLNLMIKNDFFYNKSDYKKIIDEIINEINIFYNNEKENYELIIFLNYFHIFILYYKSKSFVDFCEKTLFFILGENRNNVIKNRQKNCLENLNQLSKIKSLCLLIKHIEFTFSNFDEKNSFLKFLKQILYHVISYNRIDCRIILEKIYNKIFKIDFPHLNQNFNLLHNINNNRIDFCSKKYADEDWLDSFLHEDKNDNTSFDEEFTENEESENNEFKNEYEFNNFNFEINNKNEFQLISEINKILLNNELSEPFTYKLNKEYLGELYDDYMSVVKTPIDLYTINDKINNNEYKNFYEYDNDIKLLFNNCKTFNKKGSILYNKGIKLEKIYNNMAIKVKNNYKLIQNNNKINNNNNNNNKMDIDEEQIKTNINNNNLNYNNNIISFKMNE